MQKPIRILYACLLGIWLVGAHAQAPSRLPPRGAQQQTPTQRLEQQAQDDCAAAAASCKQSCGPTDAGRRNNSNSCAFKCDEGALVCRSEKRRSAAPVSRKTEEPPVKVIAVETPAGSYTGPVRFAGYVGPEKDEAVWVLNPEKTRIADATFGRVTADWVYNTPVPRVGIAGYQIISCFYRPGKQFGELMRSFWKGSRPQLTDEMLAYFQNNENLLADVAVEACPASAHDALALEYGDRDYQGRRSVAIKIREKKLPYTAERDARKAYADHANAERAAGDKARAEAAATWRIGAVAITAGEAASLREKITERLSRIPRSEGRDSTRLATDAASLAQELTPSMARLIGSAYVQAGAIPAGPKGRAAFDRWDRGEGGRAVALINQLALAWPHEQPMAPEIGNMVRDLMGLYYEQLDDKGTIDPGFMARIEAQLPALRAKDAADRQARDSAEAEAKAKAERSRTTTIIFLTPGEAAAYSLGSAAGKAVGSVVSGRAEIAATFSTIERELRESRKTFWQCYAQNCADPAPSYLLFSKRLKDKDFSIFSYFFYPAVLQKVSPSSRGDNQKYLAAMNFRIVEDHEIFGCNDPYSAWQAQTMAAVQKMSIRSMFDPAAQARMAQELAFGPEFAAVQRCRDRMEFAFRPR